MRNRYLYSKFKLLELVPTLYRQFINIDAAEGIYKTVQEEEFDCIDELQEKSHAGKTVMELLGKFGVLKGLPQSNQVSLFEMF